MRAQCSIVVTVLVLALTGCGSRPANLTVRASDAPNADPSGVIAQLLATAPTIQGRSLQPLSPGIADAGSEPARDYAAVDAVRLALVGTIASYATGPQYPAGAEQTRGTPSLIMAVKPRLVLKGQIPADSDGTVYIQLFGASDAVGAAHLARPGTVVAACLERAPEDVDPPTLVIDGARGRPDGQPIWNFGARGLVLADGPSGGVAYPRINELAPQQSFVGVLPTGFLASARQVRA